MLALMLDAVQQIAMCRRVYDLRLEAMYLVVEYDKHVFLPLLGMVSEFLNSQYATCVDEVGINGNHACDSLFDAPNTMEEIRKRH